MVTGLLIIFQDQIVLKTLLWHFDTFQAPSTLRRLVSWWRWLERPSITLTTRMLWVLFEYIVFFFYNYYISCMFVKIRIGSDFLFCSFTIGWNLLSLLNDLLAVDYRLISDDSWKLLVNYWTLSPIYSAFNSLLYCLRFIMILTVYSTLSNL